VPVMFEVIKYETCKLADSHDFFSSVQNQHRLCACAWHRVTSFVFVKEPCFARNEPLATFMLAPVGSKTVRKYTV
jgi:hypothetical protein